MLSKEGVRKQRSRTLHPTPNGDPVWIVRGADLGDPHAWMDGPHYTHAVLIFDGCPPRGMTVTYFKALTQRVIEEILRPLCDDMIKVTGAARISNGDARLANSGKRGGGAGTYKLGWYLGSRLPKIDNRIYSLQEGAIVRAI